MNSCLEARRNLHLYIDGELGAAEQLGFEEHLLECGKCRSEYESIRQVVDTVRGSKPLYPAADSLTPALQSILETHQSQRRRRFLMRLIPACVSAAAAVLLILLLPGVRGQRFTSFAATTHSRFAGGALALDVQSREPAVVSAWLQHHLPFHLDLPNFPAPTGQPKSYDLVGARLTEFDGSPVAYLAYRMQNRPISLLVASGPSVTPIGGEALASGKLLFHFSQQNGLKLITWRDRGLSYALVSDLQVEGAQSCVVCHGSQGERQKFENLFPGTPLANGQMN